MPAFTPVPRPEPTQTSPTLEEVLAKEEDADLFLYFVDLQVIKATDVPNVDGIFDKSDPYCEVHVGESMCKTQVIENDLNPVWNKDMNFILSKRPAEIEFEVKDKNNLKRDVFIGKGSYKIGDLFEKNESYSGEIVLKNTVEEAGKVHFQVDCKILKPIEALTKANFYKEVVKKKDDDYAALLKALDQSEYLREEAVNTISANDQKITNLERELASTTEKIVKLDGELESTTKNYEQQLQTLNENIMEKDHLLEGKNREIEDLATEVDESQEKLSTSERKLEDVKKENKRLASEQASLQAKSSTDLTCAKKELLDAEKNVQEQKKEIEKLSNEIKSLKKTCDELRNDAAQKKGCCFF